MGITTRSLDRRWYEHKYVSNSCGQLLGKAIKKYGEQAFTIEQIASAIGSLENLKLIEQELIKQLNTKVPNGYNLTDGGDGVFGYKPSAETVKRIADKKRGTKASKETKTKMSKAHSGENNHFFGKQHTEEAKQKNADAHKGNKNRLGKQHSEETKTRISKALSGKPGRPHTEETKIKLSKAHTGKKQQPVSEETRKKLSEATKAVWALRKLNLINKGF